MAKDYAVVKKWKDNPKDFQILEYCENIPEALKYIRGLPKDTRRFSFKIMKYTFSG